MVERYTGAFLLAAAMTFGLFFAMQALVATGYNAIVDNPPDIEVVIAPQLKDTPPETTTPKPPAPPVTLDPPDTPRIPPPTTNPDPTAIPTGPTAPPIKTKGPVIEGPMNGDAVPMVRMEPVYPEGARARGIEGYVVMAFDITKEGTVKNITVVEAQPKGIFERAATRALAHFKYKPRIADGVAVERQNARFQFTFSLDK